MFLYNAKAKILSFFADIRIYPGGIILFGDSHYHLKGDDIRGILNVLQPGDLLLRRYAHYLGSLAIPGHFSHGAIYVGDDKVIHMLGAGICEEDILVFTRCDDIAILRYKDPDIREAAITRAKEHLANEIEYDYYFDSKTPDRFYCTEFVDNIFDYPVRNGMDKDIIYPDHFLESDRFDIIWRKK